LTKSQENLTRGDEGLDGARLRRRMGEDGAGCDAEAQQRARLLRPQKPDRLGANLRQPVGESVPYDPRRAPVQPA
jgi:hypothetical protein